LNQAREEHKAAAEEVGIIINTNPNSDLKKTYLEAWLGFLLKLKEKRPQLRPISSALADIDAIHALAVVSRSPGYVCPAFGEEDRNTTCTIPSLPITLILLGLGLV